MKILRVLAIVLTGLFVLASCDLLFPPETQSIQECLDGLSSELNNSPRVLSSLKDLTHPDATNYNNATLLSWDSMFDEEYTGYSFSAGSTTSNSDGTKDVTATHGSTGTFGTIVFTMKETDEDFWKILKITIGGSQFFQVR